MQLASSGGITLPRIRLTQVLEPANFFFVAHFLLGVQNAHRGDHENPPRSRCSALGIAGIRFRAAAQGELITQIALQRTAHFGWPCFFSDSKESAKEEKTHDKTYGFIDCCHFDWVWRLRLRARSGERAGGGNADWEFVVKRCFVRMVLRPDGPNGISVPHFRGCGGLQVKDDAAINGEAARRRRASASLCPRDTSEAVHRVLKRARFGPASAPRSRPRPGARRGVSRRGSHACHNIGLATIR